MHKPLIPQHRDRDQDLTSGARHRDKLRTVGQENDRKLFREVMREFTPDLARAAHYIVSPNQVDHLVAATWSRAWKTRHNYPGDLQPLVWLHQIMVAVAGSADAWRPAVPSPVPLDDSHDPGESPFDEEFWVGVRQQAESIRTRIEDLVDARMDVATNPATQTGLCGQGGQSLKEVGTRRRLVGPSRSSPEFAGSSSCACAPQEPNPRSTSRRAVPFSPQQATQNQSLMVLVTERGDREAFQELVLRLTPALTRAAHHMVHPAYVDDLVQDTWYRAWKYRHTYRGDAQPSTWLHKIMASGASNPALRPTATYEGATDDLACLDNAADLEAFLVAETIDRVLAHLDDRQAMIIRRRYLAEEDWPTITEQMGFANPYLAKKAYKQAMRKLSALHEQPGATHPHSTIS